MGTQQSRFVRRLSINESAKRTRPTRLKSWLNATKAKECLRVPRLLVCIAHGCITTFCLAGATNLLLTYSPDPLNSGFASLIYHPRVGLTFATYFGP